MANIIQNRLSIRRMRAAFGVPGRIGGNKKDPSARLELLETWSGRATLLIFLGIMGEVGAVLAFQHADVSWCEKVILIGSNLAVGAGLIAEYVCIRLTISASGDLQRESDDKVASAEAMGAKANERAANAERETEQLRADNLAIQKVLTPRRIVMGGIVPPVSDLAKAAAEFAGTVAFLQWVPDFEAMTLARDIAFALNGLGWKVHVLDDSGPHIPPGYISEGVAIHTKEGPIWQTGAVLVLVGTKPVWAALAGLNKPPKTQKAAQKRETNI